MRNHKLLPLQFEHLRLRVNLVHSQLFEPMEAPDVVVARREIDVHSPVHKVEQGGYHANAVFGYDIFVFVPEVPYIPKQEEAVPLAESKIPEPGHETVFALRRVSLAQAEVHIRSEYNHKRAEQISVAQPTIRQ